VGSAGAAGRHFGDTQHRIPRSAARRLRTPLFHEVRLLASPSRPRGSQIGRSVRELWVTYGHQTRRSVRADRHGDDVVLSRHSVLIVVALIRQIWRADVDAGGSSASAFSGP